MHYKYTDIKAIVAEILENKKDEGGVKNIYFVGCGGSLGALYPAKTFMERESLTLKSGWVSSNEFVHSTPRDFGKNSIICLACHKGNTPETIAAAKLGKESLRSSSSAITSSITPSTPARITSPVTSTTPVKRPCAPCRSPWSC